MSDQIRIVEVGPRDGLQNEKGRFWVSILALAHASDRRSA